jgi:glycosyltransferase involved in cell wall biosynthesis
MSSPFFSIVIPAYNRAHLIPATIRSILRQSYTNYEIIVVDDGSTDDTEKALKPFLKENIYYFKKENAERAAARNFGTAKAKGDYINWFDSDDIMLPNHLQEAASLIEQHNSPEIFALSFAIVTASFVTIRNVILPYPSCNEYLYKENILACNPVFVKRDIALRFPFNENRMLSASEDYDLWLRLAANFTIHTSANITSQLIEHDGRSVNMRASKQKITERFETFLQNALCNKCVVDFLNNKKATFIARTYLLTAITLGLNRFTKTSLNYFLKAFTTYPFVILQRQFYVCIKVVVFKCILNQK